MSYPGWTPERKSERGRTRQRGQRASRGRTLEQTAILNSIRAQTYKPTPIPIPIAHSEIARSSPLKRARDEEAETTLPVSDAGEAAPSPSKRRKVNDNVAQPGPSRPTTDRRFYPDADSIKSWDGTLIAEAKQEDHVIVGPGVQESPMGFSLEEIAQLEAELSAPTAPPSQPPAIPTTPRTVIEPPSPGASLSRQKAERKRVRYDTIINLSDCQPVPTIKIEPPTPEVPSPRQTFERKGNPVVKYDKIINLTGLDPVGEDVDDEGWSEGWSEESSDDDDDNDEVEVELMDSFDTTREEQAILIAHPGMIHPSEETAHKPVDVKGKGKGRADPPINICSPHTMKTAPPQAGPSGTKPLIRSDEDVTLYKRVLLAIFCKLSEDDGRMALHVYKQLISLEYLHGYQAGLQASYQEKFRSSI